jgi:putative phosphoribosyl transferase
MHYFNNRTEAGRILADKLAAYSAENCVVVSLSEGGVLIGVEIASRLKSSLFLLTIENVELAGESDPIGLMSGGGSFIYNTMFSAGQLEEMISDYRQIIDQERIKTFQKLNRVLGKDGVIDKAQLKKRTIVLVSDGLKNGLSIDVAADFIKSLVVKKLIIATPVASVPAVERMHLLADEVCCLGITDNYMYTDHYYQENDVPKHEQIVELMKQVHPEPASAPPPPPPITPLGT